MAIGVEDEPAVAVVQSRVAVCALVNLQRLAHLLVN